MSTTASERIEALVVGAGPVGLTMACELARHGVPCRIVDRDEGPTEQSRALAIWPRTMEAFLNIGIADQALARGRQIHGLNAYAQGRRIVHLSLDLAGWETPFPFALSLAQGETQRLLIDRLRGHGIEVEWRTALTSLQPDDAGATATLTGPDGSTRTVRANWLLGCDGAHSVVRHALGLAFEGSAYEELFLLADVHVNGWDVPDDEALVRLLDDGGAVAAFPLPEPTRWRLIEAGCPHMIEDQAAIIERLGTLLRENGYPGVTLNNPVWAAPFKIHRRMVHHPRVGRVFVLGDAAHIHSPVGGQGMNTGVQDAYNLAWKLALVVAGASPESLLDTYAAEREPVARSILHGTDLATRAVTLRRPLAERARNTLASLLSQLDVVRHAITRNVSELGVNYRRSPLVSEDRTGLLHALLPGEETPGDHFQFSSAPHPGDRVPDVAFGGRHLFEILRSPRHVLLAFPGEHREAEDFDDRLAALASLLRDRFDRWVDAHLVAVGESPPASNLFAGPPLLDPAGELHRRFGAGFECLYLIRPDGYVGYRAQPILPEKLAAYLARIFP